MTTGRRTNFVGDITSTMPEGTGIFKRDLPNWLYLLLAMASLSYSADHLVAPQKEGCRVDAVKEVRVRQGAGRSATRVNWTVLDLSNGAGLEFPSGPGAFHAGDSVIVEISPVFKVVRRFHRPGATNWSDAGFSDDTEEMFLLVPVVGLLALLLLGKGWSDDARTMLRVVLLLMLFVWLLYMLGIHGSRLLS